MVPIVLCRSAASGCAVTAPPAVSSYVPFTSVGARSRRAPVVLRSLSCDAFRFP
jgi:hypothetical protein